MELTEEYMNRCMEDFSDSCRDFLRHSLEEMFRNYEAFIADKVVIARQQYRDMMEGMVHESKPEESLDSLLSDTKHGGNVTMSDATCTPIEYKEEAATTEEEDAEAEAADMRLLSMYRDEDAARSFLADAVVHHPLGELTDSLATLDDGDSPVEVSCELVPPPPPPLPQRTREESDECDLDATKDDDEKTAVLCCFKVDQDDVEAEVEEEVTEVYPRGLAHFPGAGPAGAIIVELNQPRLEPSPHITAVGTVPGSSSSSAGGPTVSARTSTPTAGASITDDPRYRQHQCKVCGRGFTRAFDLRRHHRTHTGERPYVCDVCGRAFTQSFPLKVHKRKHAETGLHNCNMCRRAFVKEADLMRHMSEHVKEEDLMRQMNVHVKEDQSSPVSSNPGAPAAPQIEKEEPAVVLLPIHSVPVDGKIVFQELKVEEVH